MPPSDRDAVKATRVKAKDRTFKAKTEGKDLAQRLTAKCFGQTGGKKYDNVKVSHIIN